MSDIREADIPIFLPSISKRGEQTIIDARESIVKNTTQKY